MAEECGRKQGRSWHEKEESDLICGEFAVYMAVVVVTVALALAVSVAVAAWGGGGGGAAEGRW